jgi:hypothetical protein
MSAVTALSLSTSLIRRYPDMHRALLGALKRSGESVRVTDVKGGELVEPLLGR